MSWSNDRASAPAHFQRGSEVYTAPIPISDKTVREGTDGFKVFVNSMFGLTDPAELRQYGKSGIDSMGVMQVSQGPTISYGSTAQQRRFDHVFRSMLLLEEMHTSQDFPTIIAPIERAEGLTMTMRTFTSNLEPPQESTEHVPSVFASSSFSERTVSLTMVTRAIKTTMHELNTVKGHSDYMIHVHNLGISFRRDLNRNILIELGRQQTLEAALLALRAPGSSPNNGFDYHNTVTANFGSLNIIRGGCDQMLANIEAVSNAAGVQMDSMIVLRGTLPPLAFTPSNNQNNYADVKVAKSFARFAGPDTEYRSVPYNIYNNQYKVYQYQPNIEEILGKVDTPFQTKALLATYHPFGGGPYIRGSRDMRIVSSKVNDAVPVSFSEGLGYCGLFAKGYVAATDIESTAGTSSGLYDLQHTRSLLSGNDNGGGFIGYPEQTTEPFNPIRASDGYMRSPFAFPATGTDEVKYFTSYTYGWMPSWYSNRDTCREIADNLVDVASANDKDLTILKQFLRGDLQAHAFYRTQDNSIDYRLFWDNLGVYNGQPMYNLPSIARIFAGGNITLFGKTYTPTDAAYPVLVKHIAKTYAGGTDAAVIANLNAGTYDAASNPNAINASLLSLETVLMLSTNAFELAEYSESKVRQFADILRRLCQKIHPFSSIQQQNVIVIEMLARQSATNDTMCDYIGELYKSLKQHANQDVTAAVPNYCRNNILPNSQFYGNAALVVRDVVLASTANPLCPSPGECHVAQMGEFSPLELALLSLFMRSACTLPNIRRHLDNGVNFPFDVAAVRCWIEVITGSAIFCKAGKDTAVTYMFEPWVTSARNTDIETIQQKFAVWRQAHVKQPRNVVVVQHACVSRVVQGMGTQWIDPEDYMNNVSTGGMLGERRGDMFAMILGPLQSNRQYPRFVTIANNVLSDSSELVVQTLARSEVLQGVYDAIGSIAKDIWNENYDLSTTAYAPNSSVPNIPRLVGLGWTQQLEVSFDGRHPRVVDGHLLVNKAHMKQLDSPERIGSLVGFATNQTEEPMSNSVLTDLLSRRR